MLPKCPTNLCLADAAGDRGASLVGSRPTATQGARGARGTGTAPGRSARRGGAPDGWHPCLITEGSQGPLVAGFACQRGVAVRTGLPGPDVGIIFRRAVGDNPELKVYLSNAPVHTPIAALVRVAGMRWLIETAFEESKGGLGLDHYEVRSWLGWHHHRTLCPLAHHVLVRARHRVTKGRRC